MPLLEVEITQPGQDSTLGSDSSEPNEGSSETTTLSTEPSESSAENAGEESELPVASSPDEPEPEAEEPLVSRFYGDYWIKVFAKGAQAVSRGSYFRFFLPSGCWITAENAIDNYRASKTIEPSQ